MPKSNAIHGNPRPRSSAVPYRTQEVAGSSPASSIGSPCKRGCFFTVAAALRLAAFGWSTLGQLAYGHRNVSRRCLGRAAQLAGLNDDGWPPLRFHDVRHTLASHLIVDLGLDVAQVSRLLGHAHHDHARRYTHLFEDARHAKDVRPAARTPQQP